MFQAQIPIVSLSKMGDETKIKQINDVVAAEKRIALYLNGQKLLSTMSLPDAQDAHAIGFLKSEGVIDGIEDVQSVEIAQDGLSVSVNARINDENLQNLFHEKTLTSGCCVGVSGNFDGKIVQKFISTPLRLDFEKLWALIADFEQPHELFSSTGCVHLATLILENGQRISALDVGRHNAIDKAAGKAYLSNIDISRAVLMVSGRLSLEMVIKAAMHDIPIVISRSAATQLAVKAAQLLGITLIGFARANRCNIYTHPYRILGDSQEQSADSEQLCEFFRSL